MEPQNTGSDRRETRNPEDTVKTTSSKSSRLPDSIQAAGILLSNDFSMLNGTSFGSESFVVGWWLDERQARGPSASDAGGVGPSG